VNVNVCPCEWVSNSVGYEISRTRRELESLRDNVLGNVCGMVEHDTR